MTRLDDAEGGAPIRRNWRFYFGVGFLVLSLVLPLFSLLVLSMDLPAEWKAVLIGALSLGGPEVALLAGAVCLGKETLEVIKLRAFRFLARLLPQAPVSKARYFTCLATMLLLSFSSYGYIYAYESLPDFFKNPYGTIAGDILFIMAFLAAGPEFYEKVQRLFRWEGRLAES